MINDKKIGKKLSSLRESRNESREDLAKSLNLSYSTIVKYECGFRHISDKSKIMIAEHYNVNLGELFYEC